MKGILCGICGNFRICKTANSVRERERETNRQTDRQTDRQSGKMERERVGNTKHKTGKYLKMHITCDET